MRLSGPAVALLALTLLAGCPQPMPDIPPEPPVLRRLTAAQFHNTIGDLLGDDLYIPEGLEPDLRAGGLLEVGASKAALSPRGTENFEQAAYVLAEQAMAEDRRGALVPCTPTGPVDSACAETFVSEFGRRAWRRPLTDDEVQRLTGVADQGASTLGDFYGGLEFALAGLLLAPEFLYRIELGEADPTGAWARRYSDYEMASRLSFLLWNSTPDDELLDAAERGELTQEQGLRVQLERLLTSPRSREGLRAWFADFLQLADLDDLYKETSVFMHMSDTLGASAREETLLTFETLALEEAGDLRDLLTTRRTFINRELAALYDMRAPARDGFAEAALDPDRPRRGLLGQASFLSLHAHPVSSSPTLRGRFLREVLLCQDLPGALADVDTSIPPVSEEARTLRERVQRHLEDPSCGGCHRLMDLPGLGLEHFDGIGRYRASEEGVAIDASGELDGIQFDDASGLASAIHDHPDFIPCAVQTFVRYATGVEERQDQQDGLDWLSDQFALRKHLVAELVEDLVTSPLFRQAGTISEEASP